MALVLSMAPTLAAAARDQAAPQPKPGAAAPTFGPAAPHFASPLALSRQCDSAMTQARTGLKRLQRRQADAHWLDALDAFSARLEDLGSMSSFMLHVHPDKAMRSAAEACELKWTGFYTQLAQDEALYQAAKRLAENEPSDQLLQKKLLQDFVDAGVALPPPQRKQARDLSNRIAALGQAFDRNVRDDQTQLKFTEAELQGVPEAVWKRAKRDAQGRVLLGLDYPIYGPVMQLAEQPGTRERMWRAKTNEGGQANLKLLAQITKLRLEYAQLLGAKSWADFLLRRRMAQTPERAQAFLDDVKTAVQQRERDELAELRSFKARHLQQPEQAVHIHRWDVSFYTERVGKARFDVDQEAMRAYFPPQASLDFVLHLIEKMMGVKYQRLAAADPSATAWHHEVQTYQVSDAASGKPMGTLWVDLYPREGKYKHAAVWGLHAASALQNRASQAALVVNFDRKGLTLDELETLLHELGHAVHNNLSTTRRSLLAGTSVLHDFAEAPSQMLEDWVYDKEVLKLFAEVCPSCKPVPDELLDKARAAKHYGKGMLFSRQQLYAAYDLALYGPKLQDPMALWAQMEGATPLGHVPGTMFPAGFSHIAGHYGAGYYGYLWSLVVAMDLRTAFAGNRIDPVVGRRYRDTVLAQGGQRLPQALVKDFLGRDFNAKAFFDDLKQ